jgi:hypothetical protein
MKPETGMMGMMVKLEWTDGGGVAEGCRVTTEAHEMMKWRR